MKYMTESSGINLGLWYNVRSSQSVALETPVRHSAEWV